MLPLNRYSTSSRDINQLRTVDNFQLISVTFKKIICLARTRSCPEFTVSRAIAPITALLLQYCLTRLSLSLSNPFPSRRNAYDRNCSSQIPLKYVTTCIDYSISPLI
jgi:hypothetical protein